MNILLMAVMMGLAMFFFHGRGHHKPSPSNEHHATTPGEATARSPEAPGVSRQSGEPRREPNSDPKAPGEAEPASPTPKAE